MRFGLVVSTLAVLALAGCESGKKHAEVDGVLVPQARSVIDAPEGATVRLPGDDLATLPDAEVIRVAAARDVPWSKVKAVVDRIEEAGKKPVLLVGKRDDVHGFQLSDPVSGPTIAVTATIDGKICVSPPGNPEAKCVQTMSKDQIDRAHTRRLVREAVRGYKLYEADLELQGDLSWANVVRAIDGVRTCCLKDRVAVKLNW